MSFGEFMGNANCCKSRGLAPFDSSIHVLSEKIYLFGLCPFPAHLPRSMLRFFVCQLRQVIIQQPLGAALPSVYRWTAQSMGRAGLIFRSSHCWSLGVISDSLFLLVAGLLLALWGISRSSGLIRVPSKKVASLQFPTHSPGPDLATFRLDHEAVDLGPRWLSWASGNLPGLYFSGSINIDSLHI